MNAGAVQFGYKLSSEEFEASELVRLAAVAEDHGFSFALISDHYHPWTGSQGQSPFVWSVLGGVAATTNKITVGTGVTCPTVRIHPAIVAQASATMATMMRGRFFLGVGTGENLNEHIVGARWPEVSVRQEMLEEAIGVIRLLWQGGLHSHHGRHYTVENARLYSIPDEPPPLFVAASGPRSARLAAREGDGLICTGLPDPKVIDAFTDEGGPGKPRYGELTVCFDESEERARRTVKEIWPIVGLGGPLFSELPLPSHFESAASLVGDQQLAEVPVGPNPQTHIDAIRRCIDGGYDHVCIHQVGPNQDAFMAFYAREVLPRIANTSSVRR
jgi:coenzyme F420-dependent glucose-6-phosphate dehydrogenase